MKKHIKQRIVELVRDYASWGKNISVVWYGGEPMLDFASIKQMSKRFIDICKQHSVEYSATMISNGFLFECESVSLLDELAIKSVQITVDGMEKIHEMRRPTTSGENSFNRILDNIVDINSNSNAQMHLRINVDKKNISSAYDLVKYCAGLGLTDIDVNLGMMKVFGCDHSCVALPDRLFSMKEFSKEFLKFREHLKYCGFHKAIEKMEPEYKVNSCTMDAPNAYVIDPNGFVYKCISKVGQEEYSIGNISRGFDENAHTHVSPFDFPTCTKCKYFPICKGGCLLNNAGKNRECNIWKYITEELLFRVVG